MWAWLLLALAATAPFWSLGHPLIEVDDARYAEVPREMVQTGDWATPHLDYMDYVEKPPLGYWLTAASYEIFGVGEAQARLPLALLALAGLLLTAWLGSWLYDPMTGVLGAAALGSMGLFFFLSHYITPDFPLTIAFLAQTALMLRCMLRPEDCRWAAPAAWACAAAAFLAKGLIALVLPGAWAVALWLLFPKWRPGLRRLISPLGIVLFCALTAPWFIVMERRHPGFLHLFFIEQHFERFLTHKYNRDSPWYFFLLVLPAALLPWAPAALAALARRPRQWLAQPADAALALWAAIVTAFFSLSHSKLATYILPVLPHLALLSARQIQDELPRLSRKLSTALGLALLAVAGAAPWVPQLPRQALPWAPLGVAILGATLLAAVRLRDAAKRACAFGYGGLALGAAFLLTLNSGQALLSAKPVAQAIAARAQDGDAVWAYDIYVHGLSFYLRRPVDKIIYWIGELAYAKKEPGNAARFGDDGDVRRLPQKGRRTFVVLRAREALRFAALAAPGSIAFQRRYGAWELVEFRAGR